VYEIFDKVVLRRKLGCIQDKNCAIKRGFCGTKSRFIKDAFVLPRRTAIKAEEEIKGKACNALINERKIDAPTARFAI
jgi:hypothetical protein